MKENNYLTIETTENTTAVYCEYDEHLHFWTTESVSRVGFNTVSVMTVIKFLQFFKINFKNKF